MASVGLEGPEGTRPRFRGRIVRWTGRQASPRSRPGSPILSVGQFDLFPVALLDHRLEAVDPREPLEVVEDPSQIP